MKIFFTYFDNKLTKNKHDNIIPFIKKTLFKEINFLKEPINL